MRIAIKTLGCKVNQSESASMEAILRGAEYEIVSPDEHPDVFIINTCTVTEKSDRESRQLIRRAVRSGARVIVTGCYAQIRPNELSNIRGVDFVIGNKEKSQILEFVEKIRHKNGSPEICVSPSGYSLEATPYYSERARAFLKIQDGCNLRCSYCTVPLARGRSRSLPLPDVISSIERLRDDGYREVVITGIHIGTYGLDLPERISLLDMLKIITEKFPEIRFRLSSIEPQEFRDEYLDLIKDGKVCAHLHIPLQSGSDRILQLMNRHYSVKEYSQIINKISTSNPDICIGTDIIVGFPGETENDFNTTVDLLNDLRISYIHVFPYSKRPGTVASEFDSHVSEPVKNQRVRIVREISETKRLSFKNSQIGKILDVIIEKPSDIPGYYKGISDNYIKLLVRASSLSPGQRIKVKVISLTGENLISEPLK